MMIPPVNPSDEMIEAWALGRADESQRLAVESWASKDPTHARYLEESRRQALAVNRALLEAAAEEVGPPDDESMARYLDGELTDEERTSFEVGLSGVPGAQARLVALFREGQAVTGMDEAIITVESHPAGEQIMWAQERERRQVKETSGGQSTACSNDMEDVKSRKR